MKHSNRIHCNVQTRRRLRATLEQTGWVCDRLWLQNDFVKTSSVYQNMRPGRLKRVVRFIAEELISKPAVSRALVKLGLEECARPSIYCVCRRPET